MVIKDGRFGPYVTDGETNASLRKGDEVASITVQRAAELLADRRVAPPVTRKRATPAKKTATAKKTTTTKTATTKTATTKTVAAKPKAGTTARSATERS
jgi:DNA topoisomerase-1